MISSFSILFLGGLLSPLLWRRGVALKPAALALLFVALLFTGDSIGLLGFSADGVTDLFAGVLILALAAVVMHTESEHTITQTLFLGAAAVALLQSRTLLSFLIAFEAVSLLSVVLVSQIRTPEQAEGAVKIFIAGAVATGILMLGAFFYTLGGGSLLEGLKPLNNGYGTIGLFIMLLGVFYKLTIVPMHNWAVDTYSLVRADHAALLSGAAKTVAALAAFTIFAPALKGAITLTVPILVTLALITMTLGNFMALAQKRLARILAWSSVAHAGYMLLAYAAVRSELALTGLLYMAIAYLFMQSAVFLVLDVLRRWEVERLEDLSGLGAHYPVIALFFTLQLFSLAGIPLLAGFLGKAVLFTAGVEAGLWWAVLVALLNSALSVAYYAWIVKQLWFDRSERGPEGRLLTPATLGAQLILLTGTLWFGIFAGTVFAAGS